MPNVSIKIDTSEVKAAIAALRREAPKAIADALNRTAFEVLDAEERDVRGAFQFASQSTQKYLARGFAFEKATPTKLAVTIHANPGARSILEKQQFGGDLKAGDPEAGLRLGAQIAVPQREVPRGARGRVPVAHLPGRIIRRSARGRSRGFVSGRAVFERVKGGGVRFLYALADRVRIRPRLDFFGTAARTAQREFPKKAHRVLEKLALTKGGR